jgi:hypothetical protein
MMATQASCKIYASRCDVEPRELIEVFHRWIQRGRTGELLIDVADYSHVHGGPGVMLIAHDGFYAMDEEQGRPGMKWRRRRGEPAAAYGLLCEAAERALAGAAELEQHLPGRVAFDGSELLVGFDDRLRVTSTPESFQALRGDLDRLAAAAYGSGAGSVEPSGDPRGCFRARLQSSEAPSLSQLRQRLKLAGSAELP